MTVDAHLSGSRPRQRGQDQKEYDSRHGRRISWQFLRMKFVQSFRKSSNKIGSQLSGDEVFEIMRIDESDSGVGVRWTSKANSV